MHVAGDLQWQSLGSQVGATLSGSGASGATRLYWSLAALATQSAAGTCQERPRLPCARLASPALVFAADDLGALSAALVQAAVEFLLDPVKSDGSGGMTEPVR